MSAPTPPLREEIPLAGRDASRRRLARDLSHARDQVSVAAGLSGPVDIELARAFARNYLRTWPYHFLLTVALLAVATLWIEPLRAGTTLVLMSALILATCLACHRLQSRDLAPGEIRAWRAAFVASELAQSVGWLLFSLPLLLETKEAHVQTAHSFLLLSVLLVMLATAILRAPILPAVLACLAPLSLIVVGVALEANGPEERALALLTLSALFFFFSFSHRLHSGAVATVRSKAEIRASIAELEQVKANSGEARRRADEADRAKTLFLATMSHELRTPLNAILGFSEVMKNEVFGSHSTPSYREYSSDIHGSGQQLLSLINEILELARIEAGQYALQEEDVRLGDLIAETIEVMRPRAEAKNHAVRPVIDASLQPVRVDPRAVRQMIANLLSNAIKFTPPGGHIAVKAGWTSLGGQYVSVKDDGPGIPADEIPLALSSFGRGSHAVATAEQGAGLGLPIVKGLADLHGGRFLLNSTPREGTEAVAILPASRVCDDPASARMPQRSAAA